MSEPYIRLQNVAKTYDTKGGAVEACVDINLDIRSPSSSRSSARAAAARPRSSRWSPGSCPYTSGTITVGGNVVDRPQTDVGIVFQDAIMLDWRNVLANVMLQIDIRRMDRAQVRAGRARTC